MTDASGNPSPTFTPAEPAPGGARVRQRDSLFLTAMLIREDGRSTEVRVRNLSEGGVMAEGVQPIAMGAPVIVVLRGIGEAPGRVAWYVDHRAGIAFDQPIDPKRARKPVAGRAAKTR